MTELTDKGLNIIASQWHLNMLGEKDKADLMAFARAAIAADRALQADEIAEKDALLRQANEAVRSVAEWDRARKFLVPYRVRDPIHAVSNAITKHLEQKHD